MHVGRGRTCGAKAGLGGARGQRGLAGLRDNTPTRSHWCESTGEPGGPGVRFQTATRPHWCGGRRRVRRARMRCRWAVAGPGRTTSNAQSHQHTRPHWCGGHRRVRRARSKVPNSDQAPLVWRAPEGPEGTGGLRGAAPNAVRPPSLAGGRGLRRLEHPWGHKQPGPQDSTRGARNTRGATDNKAARPQWGRAAQQVSEAHRRITTMSGSPRPLSWRTLEMPSLAATSFAVPSMRGSS